LTIVFYPGINQVMNQPATYTAFAGDRRIASGPLEQTVLRTKAHLDRGETAPVLVFEDHTGVQIDFDWRGTPDEVVARLAAHPYLAQPEPPPAPRTGPGRPKLGVVSREVSLLPRHWDFLKTQAGGASATLRRLVDEARKREPGRHDARRAAEAASRFMWAMAGNLPNFEEASRALFAGDRQRFTQLISDWPEDIRCHLGDLVAAAGASGSAG
jgi:hypothetical protein